MLFGWPFPPHWHQFDHFGHHFGTTQRKHKCDPCLCFRCGHHFEAPGFHFGTHLVLFGWPFPPHCHQFDTTYIPVSYCATLRVHSAAVNMFKKQNGMYAFFLVLGLRISHHKCLQHKTERPPFFCTVPPIFIHTNG